MKARKTQTSKLQQKNQQDRALQNRACRFGLKFPPCKIGPATGVSLEMLISENVLLFAILQSSFFRKETGDEVNS